MRLLALSLPSLLSRASEGATAGLRRIMDRSLRRAGSSPPGSAGGNSAVPITPAALTPGRRLAFLGITLLVPLLVLALLELALRVTVPSAAYPLFVPAPYAVESHLLVNRHISERWFAGLADPPAPKPEPFAAVKAQSAFRVFVLGESSAAGFPYRGNVTFAALLRDALVTALPRDSVEVVNLAMAAINSYAFWDTSRDLPEQRPDAVVIYGGHNEYYGALGVGSQQGSVLPTPWLIRSYLRLLRYRTLWVMRNLLGRLSRDTDAATPQREAPGLMEILAREQQIEFGGESYRAGVQQFESNLAATVDQLAHHGIPVFIASVASNLRDQRPFAAAENDAPGNAVETYTSATRLRARGDTAAARALFQRARDADVVRFRAPTEFNSVIRRIAQRRGVWYVPVAEAFEQEALDGIPGRDLFLEHVHPNRHGHMVIARAFFDALAGSGLLDRPGQSTQLDWAALASQAPFTEFDERVVEHLIQTITTRWPFVPSDQARDYRAEYRPQGLLDSLAFAVSRGVPWQRAKLELASNYEEAGRYDAAAAEYRTLIDDAPLFPEPRLMLARALAAAGHDSLAEAELRRAAALRRSPEPFVLLARAAMARRAHSEAVEWIVGASQLAPDDPDILYQLSLAQALAGNAPEARRHAVRLAQLAPGYPGLKDWLSVLGVSP